MNKLRPILLVLTAVAALSVAYPARANFIETIHQVGANVVATGSGSFNLTGLTLIGTATTFGVSTIQANEGVINVNPTTGLPMFLYTGFTGPTSFGSGSGFMADVASGDTFILDAFGGARLFSCYRIMSPVLLYRIA